jgi:hypothetical protein
MYKINNSLKLNTCDKNENHKHPKNMNMNMNMNMNNDNDSNMIHEDIAKLHLLPAHCPMTPKSYTDFFNHNTQEDNKRHLPGVSPYKLEKVKHPREGYKYTMEYNNFYTDWNKDALHYTSSNNEFLDSYNNNHNHNHNHNQTVPTILTNVNSESIRLYKETKPNHEFARPMKMNGSNKVQDLFDNCMNKKTFEYTRYSQISPHHKQWIDNPIFTEDISEETQDLKNNYMNDTEKDNMSIYSSVFEDMYYLSNENDINYNPSDYKYYNYLNKLQKQIDNQYKNNNFIVNDTIKKSKEENIQKLDTNLDNRNLIRSKNIKPNKKYFNNNNYNNYDNYDNNNGHVLK